MEVKNLDYFEKRENIRHYLEDPVPVALKSDFSKVIYRNFLMKNFSTSGIWVEFPCNNLNSQFALLPILIHQHQKKYSVYFNVLKYKEIAGALYDISNTVEQNLWIELPCEIKRYEKMKNSFGLGLHFFSN